jgi:hypothetical protein
MQASMDPQNPVKPPLRPITDSSDTPIHSYILLLAAEIVKEVGKTAESNKELCIQLELADGNVVVVGFGVEMSREISKAVQLVCDI